MTMALEMKLKITNDCCFLSDDPIMFSDEKSNIYQGAEKNNLVCLINGAHC